jgi:hypothetical protein
MLSEALEKPVSTASLKTNFEWDVAYIFPLAVIGLIQLLLIFALLSEFGFLPSTFLNAYLSLQSIADNNLYKILGIAMLIISVYPFVLKPDIIKKSHGAIIAFVGIIFLARGFVDVENIITNMYDVVFAYFDFPIAVIALILIVYVIVKILMSAKDAEKESRIANHIANEENFNHPKKVHHSKKHQDFDYEQKRKSIHVKNRKPVSQAELENGVKFSNQLADEKPQTGINKSSDKIQFESNDILDDYKK